MTSNPKFFSENFHMAQTICTLISLAKAGELSQDDLELSCGNRKLAEVLTEFTDDYHVYPNKQDHMTSTDFSLNVRQAVTLFKKRIKKNKVDDDYIKGATLLLTLVKKAAEKFPTISIDDLIEKYDLMYALFDADREDKSDA